MWKIKHTVSIKEWFTTISRNTPVIVQQFGDKAIVERAIFPQVQMMTHYTLQQGHSCREQSHVSPDTSEMHRHVDQDYFF